jgi:hypothetical protein
LICSPIISSPNPKAQLKLAPCNTEYHKNRGIAYELMGLYDKSQEDFKKSMELEEEKKKKKKRKSKSKKISS